MFPIADSQGRVQGFGGRTLDPNDPGEVRQLARGPPVQEAQPAVRAVRGPRGRRPHQVLRGRRGVHRRDGPDGRRASNRAVACMGTSLTTDQIRLLRRWAPEVRLCFDADAAGEHAAWRSVEAAADVNLAWSAVRLPIGQDPGDLAADAGRPGGPGPRRRVLEASGTFPDPFTGRAFWRVSPGEGGGSRGDRRAASAVPRFGGEGRRGSLDRKPASAVPGLGGAPATAPSRMAAAAEQVLPAAHLVPRRGPRAPLPGDGRRPARRQARALPRRACRPRPSRSRRTAARSS